MWSDSENCATSSSWSFKIPGDDQWRSRTFDRLVRWSNLPPFRFHLTCIGLDTGEPVQGQACKSRVISTLTLVCGDGRSAVSTHLPHPFYVSHSTLPFHLPLPNYTNLNPTIGTGPVKQNAIVYIQLNIVTCHTNPFTRGMLLHRLYDFWL